MNTSDVPRPPAAPSWELRTLVLACAIGFLVGVASSSAELAVASAALALEAVRGMRDSHARR